MKDPFQIEGPAQVGFSGGRTSGYLVHRLLEAWSGTVPPDVRICFENTGEEDEATLEFVEACSQRWGFRVFWLEYNDVFDLEDYRKADGSLREQRQRRNYLDFADLGFAVVDFRTANRTGRPYDMMLDYYAAYRRHVKGAPPVLPNVPQRMCSAHLKIKVADRFMRWQGYDHYEAVAGIRADEPRRYHKMMSGNDRGDTHYEYRLPLYEAGIEKPEILGFWRDQPFDLQLDPQGDEGNCRYCFLKTPDKLVRIMRKQIDKNGGLIPADLLRWAEREQWTGQTYRSDRPDTWGLVQLAYQGVELPESGERIADCICGE